LAKGREKVQQQGFWDPEVSSPDHDTIVLWAYNNPELIVRAVHPELFDRPWRREDVRKGYCESPPGTPPANLVETERPNPRFICRLEHRLEYRHGYQDRNIQVVGFADLLIVSELPYIEERYLDKYGGQKELAERALIWSCDHTPRVLVEVKSKLPTLGELLRQINTYRSAFMGKYVVVAPDDTYGEVLSEQGVHFIKYAG
jgi:hypothetical protein